MLLYYSFSKKKTLICKICAIVVYYIKQIIVLDLAMKKLTDFHLFVVCLFHGHEQKELMTFRIPLLFPSMRSWNHQNVRDIHSQENYRHL